MVIERQRGRRTLTETIPAAEILDIDYNTAESLIRSRWRAAGRRAAGITDAPPATGLAAASARFLPNQGLIVKTRKGLFTFGQGLEIQEVRLVVWIVKKSLAALPADRA
jgi:hypothetical protein